MYESPINRVFSLACKFLVIDFNNYDSSKILSVMRQIKLCFYKLFITNLNTQEIMRKLMYKFIKTQNSIKLKFKIIEITSIFEMRISQGTRHIIHFEAYIIRLIYIFNKYKNDTEYYNNLDNLNTLEI